MILLFCPLITDLFSVFTGCHKADVSAIDELSGDVVHKSAHLDMLAREIAHSAHNDHRTASFFLTKTAYPRTRYHVAHHLFGYQTTIRAVPFSAEIRSGVCSYTLHFDAGSA